jgi:hypothetical protein
MVQGKSIVSVVVLLLLAGACTSTPDSGPHESSLLTALPAGLRSPAPRTDCPLSPVRASAVAPSKLSVLMKGHVPTWIPGGFGLVGAFGPYLGFGSHTPGGGAIWVTEKCRSIEVSAYTARVPAGWSIFGGSTGCSNAVLGEASCWTIQAPGIGQTFFVQAMGLSVRDTMHIARSMRPTPSPKGLLCPDVLRNRKPQPPDLAGSTRKVIPGQPLSLQLCRYRGLGKNPRDAQRLTRAAGDRTSDQINKLVRTLDNLHKVPSLGIFSCPLDTGAADLLRFSYGDGSRLDLIVARSGCRFAQNGRSVWYTTPALRHLIDRIF